MIKLNFLTTLVTFILYLVFILPLNAKPNSHTTHVFCNKEISLNYNANTKTIVDANCNFASTLFLKLEHEERVPLKTETNKNKDSKLYIPPEITIE